MNIISKNLSHLTHILPDEVRQRDVLPSHFSSPTCPFHGLFRAIFAIFLCFLVLILLGKMASLHGGEVLSHVPKCEKAVMWLTKKITV